jgi:intracellular sulfur oxidation DsrE/DsrF family protein
MLKRRADVICKIYSKLENKYPEMIQNLVALMKEPVSTEIDVKRKTFALYNFEVLAEYHLPQE